MTTGKWKMVLVVSLISLSVNAQFDPSKVCRVENGKLIFTLNGQWSNAQKLEIARLFDLDSILVFHKFDGIKEITVKGTIWHVSKLDASRVELSKPMGSESTPTGTGSVIILDDRWINAEGVNKRESEVFGVNRFTLFNVFNYRSGTATFYLPRQKQAQKIYLSGTFNNWGTMQTPMMKSDSGWVVSIKLAPGKYLYKYIVDGQWMPDPYNRLHEDDNNGGYNSVVFGYNFRFYLNGYRNAKKVFLAGSFNGWNGQQLSMVSTADGWVLYMYLREGTHAYKFIVDQQWILDPGNKVVRPDGTGHQNSFLSIGDTFYFRLSGHREYNHVNVAGNFNAWNPNELFMEQKADGWELAYVLAPGNYQYKFIHDGKWITDPGNPQVAHWGGETNSFLVIKPNHTFILEHFPEAGKVIVTGNFTGWSGEDYPMLKERDKWIFRIFLKPGKYTYKFIVDGKWMEDPANDEWETNEYGSKNSVLWIEP